MQIFSIPVDTYDKVNGWNCMLEQTVFEIYCVKVVDRRVVTS